MSCCLAWLPNSVVAASGVILTWNPSISSNVIGYRIYYGLTSGVYNTTLAVPGATATNTTVTGLTAGTTYYFAATAMDSLGDESQFSNEAVYSVPTNSVVATNQPPTLNALSNLTLNANAALQTVNLSGISSGIIGLSPTLTVTAVSSNPSLIPNPTVNYTSPGTTGSLTFKPASNVVGTATLSVTVNNGQSVSNLLTRTFTVTVNSASQIPTLDPLNDATIAQNSGVQKVALTGIGYGNISYAQRATLAVTAVSSNLLLIPDPTISYTSPNSTGTLRFTPTTGVSGTTVISVTVKNGHYPNSLVTRSFTVTIVSTNQTPILIALPTNVLAVKGQTVTFSVAAAGEAPLAFQWQRNSKALPSATNAVLKLSGVLADQAGEYSVSVSNDLGTTNAAATLTVNPTPAATLATVTPPVPGEFAMSVSGITGYRYVVESSIDLVNWSPAETNTAPFTFVDTNASQFKLRFYRSFYLP